ncbi:hypothetical protein DYB37_013158 [Aphanomyces astaci]|uniref:Mre11 DNA-binding domain-containing protein n=1 Tax=Aphanomyces astaci TaxID=112090 RepID=A0A3R7F3G3_APHAT|nr:hypothetical protein DYB35_012862 [Aphanomyces astaci]RHZ22927.1 hypothetical protein DYB37_013158 [Aphanomyces astaci]
MKVQQLIDEAAAETPNQDTAMQVLVRVKVDHSGFPVLGNQRFGSQFVGKVANPSDILLFSRDKKGATDDDASSAACGSSSLKNPIRPGAPPASSMLCVEQLLSNHLAGSDKVLEILPETNLAHALDDFVFKNIPTAFGDIYDTVLEESQGALKKNKATLNKHDIQSLVEKNLERIKASQAVHVGQSAMDTHEVLRMLQTTTTTQGGDGEHDNDLDGLSDDDGHTTITTTAAKHGRGRGGRGGAAASVKATTSTPARKAAKQPKHANKKQSTHRFSDSDDQSTYGGHNDDNDDDVVVVMSSSGSDFDEPPLRQTARKPAAASKRPPAATKRKAATRRGSISDALSPSSSTRKKQKTISALFSQSATPLPPATATTTYGASSWRDGGTQATTQGTSTTTQRRKLPLSFSSYTQDDDADVRSSALPPSSANAWGRAKK